MLHTPPRTIWNILPPFDLIWSSPGGLCVRYPHLLPYPSLAVMFSQRGVLGCLWFLSTCPDELVKGLICCWSPPAHAYKTFMCHAALQEASYGFKGKRQALINQLNTAISSKQVLYFRQCGMSVAVNLNVCSISLYAKWLLHLIKSGFKIFDCFCKSPEPECGSYQQAHTWYHTR